MTWPRGFAVLAGVLASVVLSAAAAAPQDLLSVRGHRSVLLPQLADLGCQPCSGFGSGLGRCGSRGLGSGLRMGGHGGGAGGLGSDLGSACCAEGFGWSRSVIVSPYHRVARSTWSTSASGHSSRLPRMRS